MSSNSNASSGTAVLESDVTAHYDGGELLASIRTGVTALGKTPATVTIEELGPVDEFHIGGRPATTELCEQLGVSNTDKVLDIGCGIGGAARFVASTFGCRVTGLDLVPNYIDVARELTNWTSLSQQVDYEAGSALEMPFPDGEFDHAFQLHVAMNIADKSALFNEVARVLRPGGQFAVYDIMRTDKGEIEFPMPWAADASMSFVEELEVYRTALEGAGFEITKLRNRGEFAKNFFAAMRAKTEKQGGPPPLGLHVILGANAPTKVSNMISALNDGRLAPVEIICQKPDA